MKKVNIKKSEYLWQQRPEAKCLGQLLNRLVVKNGVLKRKYDDVKSNSTCALLTHARVEVLSELHGEAMEGHLGVEKTL